MGVNLNPHKLLHRNRFDVIIKYLYAKSIVNNYNTSIFKDMYKEHLRIWNEFKERGNPKKETFEAFDSEFKNIINSINSNGFDKSISTIPCVGGNILNGAHRLAASLLLNKDIYVENGVDGVDGMLDCSWEFFKKLGYPTKYANLVAIEYSKLKKNTHMVLVFPSAVGHREKVFGILNKYGKVFYNRDVEITGSLNLMRELYLDEPWGGTYSNNFIGLRSKAGLCYPKKGNTSGYLVEFNNLNNAIKAKEEIRAIYNIGKHSVHINDTHPETVRISKLIFNDNSIHHLNNSIPVNFKKYNDYLNEFKQLIASDNLDVDDYCVTASSTMSAYGLREGSDLDYLHKDNSELKSSKNVSSHNNYSVGKYHVNKDEVIYNPDHHFYSNGVKFASLDVVRKLKEKRGEDKDIIDVNLINRVL